MQKLKTIYQKNPSSISNKGAYNGVYQNKKNGMWVAQITFKKKTYYLGSYKNIEDAVKARKNGEAMYEDFLDGYYTEHPDKKRKTKTQQGETAHE